MVAFFLNVPLLTTRCPFANHSTPASDTLSTSPLSLQQLRSDACCLLSAEMDILE